MILAWHEKILIVIVFLLIFLKCIVFNPSSLDVENEYYHPNEKCYNFYKPLDGSCESTPLIKINDDELDELEFIYNYFNSSHYSNLALIITAQSALETGWWKSNFHNERNNYWSRKMLPDGINCLDGEMNCLLTHRNILDACQKMERYLKRKGYDNISHEQYFEDLRRLNFATDPLYEQKVRNISKLIYKILQERQENS